MSSSNKQLVIGITMALDDYGRIREGTDYSFIRTEYGEQVRQAGAQPIFLEPNIDPQAAAELCGGIVISGGEDIDPSFYAQPREGVKNIEPVSRTNWERQLIDACDKAGVPILGICYGEQLLNVHYGGTLYQDISQHENVQNHGTSGAAAIHDIQFDKDFLNFKAGQRVNVASRHHQAVHEVAPGFEVVARSDDGIIEAIAGFGHVGVQWHAESDATAPQIYGAFIRHCTSQKQSDATATPDAVLHDS